MRLLVAGGGDAPVVGVLLEDLQGPLGRLAGPDDDVDVDRLPLLDVGRERDLLDQDFLVVEVVDRQDVDLDARAPWRRGPARWRCRGSRCRRRSTTIRRAVSSGKVARASLMAPPRSVYWPSTVLSIPSVRLASVELRGRLDAWAPCRRRSRRSGRPWSCSASSSPRRRTRGSSRDIPGGCSPRRRRRTSSSASRSAGPTGPRPGPGRSR